MAVPTHYLPHPTYAEDQPFSRTILYTHCLSRGFQSGALITLPLVTARHFYTHRTTSALLPHLLRSTGVSGVIGVALMAVAVPARMWGKEEIEWQDRSWRLLENKGQVEVDVFGAVGAVAGAGMAAATQGLRRAGWRSLLGGAGLGGTVGLVGYMGWRHGVKGGRWEDAVVAVVEEVNPVMPVEGRKEGPGKR